jgi:Holliday junction resolvase
MNKIKGRNFENYVKKKLKREGYFVVRSADSKLPDLVALKGDEILLVECKFNNYLPESDRRALLRIKNLVPRARIMLATHEFGRVVFKEID